MHTPPPPLQQILYPSRIVNKINNADHFEFIIPAFEEDISRFSIFVFIIMIYFLCLLMFLEPPPPPPPPLSHTHNDENTGSTFAYFLVKRSETRFPSFTCKRLPAVSISLTNKNVDISLKILLIAVHAIHIIISPIVYTL